MPSIPSYDPTRQYLGKLCKRQHEWGNTGKSLRYSADRTCLACTKVRKPTGRSRERFARTIAVTNTIKVERGCTDCGFRAHPAALEFDHLPGTTKRFAIARVMSSVGLDRLLSEIAKCEVVCANCHAIREANRRAERKQI